MNIYQYNFLVWILWMLVLLACGILFLWSRLFFIGSILGLIAMWLTLEDPKKYRKEVKAKWRKEKPY